MDYGSFAAFFNNNDGQNGDRVITDRYIYEYDSDKNAFFIVKNSIDIEKNQNLQISTTLNSGVDIYIDSDNDLSLTSGNDASITSTNDITIDSTNLIVDSTNTTFNSATDSTTYTDGSIVIDGGVGIAKNLNVNGVIKVEGSGYINANDKDIINVPNLSLPSDVNDVGLDKYAVNKSYIDTITPPGAVMSFLRDSAPDGWITCDGSAVNRTSYSRLFSLLGTRYGEGDGSLTFNLPDLRGTFLRGHNPNTQYARNEFRISSTKYSTKRKKIIKIESNRIYLDDVNGLSKFLNSPTNTDYQEVLLERGTYLVGYTQDTGGLSYNTRYYIDTIDETDKYITISNTAGGALRAITSSTDTIGMYLTIPYFNITSVVTANPTNTITVNRDHGNFLSNGKAVVIRNCSVTGAIPGGLTIGNVYYLISKSGNSYQLSLTSGGSAIDLTSTGDVGAISLDVVENYVGSYQESGMMDHSHRFEDTRSANITYYNTGVAYNGNGGNSTSDEDTTKASSYDDRGSESFVSYYENRPQNVSVLYCIKY